MKTTWSAKSGEAFAWVRGENRTVTVTLPDGHWIEMSPTAALILAWTIVKFTVRSVFVGSSNNP